MGIHVQTARVAQVLMQATQWLVVAVWFIEGDISDCSAAWITTE